MLYEVIDSMLSCIKSFKCCTIQLLSLPLSPSLPLTLTLTLTLSDSESVSVSVSVSAISVSVSVSVSVSAVSVSVSLSLYVSTVASIKQKSKPVIKTSCYFATQQKLSSLRRQRLEKKNLLKNLFRYHLKKMAAASFSLNIFFSPCCERGLAHRDCRDCNYIQISMAWPESCFSFFSKLRSFELRWCDDKRPTDMSPNRPNVLAKI